MRRHEHQVEPNHESLFLQRYERLVAFAAGLCGQDRDQAEDLVHDAFLAFTQARPDLLDIENLDGYLRGMLRKLRVSAVRRAARGGETSLSMIEHDSADLALRAVGAATVEAKLELECVCRYACTRKASSKAGSILILRFFHGYFPSEVARIARCDVRVVDEWLRIARREAKLFRDAPSRLKFLGEAARSAAASASAPIVSVAISTSTDDPAEYLRAIQDAIFRTGYGSCPARHTLDTFYASSPSHAMDAASLAHLVSCRTCLDRVTRILRLDSSDDRFPNDMLGPGRGAAPRAPRTGRSAAQTARRRERRWRTSYEHRASKLRIFVNGFLVGSHTVGSAVTRQTVAVTLDEPVGSVEVFGEGRVRLAFLDVESQPGGAVEQRLVVPLSEDRVLRVAISFARPWPEVDVEYEDPHWRASSIEDVSDEDTDSLSSRPQQPDGRWPVARWWSSITARRWTLALAGGCLIVAWLLMSNETVVWAAERVSQTIAAFVRELVSGSQRSHELKPLPSRPMSFVAPPVVAPTRGYNSFALRESKMHVPPSAEMLARTEIEALARLDAVDALLDGQLEVRKAATHAVVRGLVDDGERKRRVIEALQPLRRAGLARLDVSTIAEHLQRMRLNPQPVETLRYESLSFDATSIPAADALRDALLRQPEWTHAPAPAVDLEIRRIATVALNVALSARQHGALLQSVADRYHAAALHALSPDAYDAWRKLLSTHASAVQDDLTQLRTLLEPLRQPLPPSPDAPAPAQDDADALNEVAEQLARAAATLDDTMRAALSASSGPTAGTPALTDPHLWDLVRRAERLAHALIL